MSSAVVGKHQVQIGDDGRISCASRALGKPCFEPLLKHVNLDFLRLEFRAFDLGA